MHPVKAQVVAIIPARLGSTRLPGKVLLRETGKPLIQHVFEAVCRSGALSRVVVATDSQDVLAACRGFGAEGVLTSAEHPNGTSRLAEAAQTLGLGEKDVIVNVQGDEPEVEPETIDAAVGALVSGEPQAKIGTVAVPFQAHERPEDPNCVKVVLAASGAALYFTRACVPFNRDSRPDGALPLRHVGLYAYRHGFLKQYVALAPTPLEQTEQLEQLRALEHGYAIRVAVCPQARIGIDTPEQYAAFVARVRGDKTLKRP